MWGIQKPGAQLHGQRGGSSVCPGLPQAVETAERPACLLPPWTELLRASERKQLAAPPAHPAAGKQNSWPLGLAARPGLCPWPHFLYRNFRVRLGRLTAPSFRLFLVSSWTGAGKGSWRSCEGQASVRWVGRGGGEGSPGPAPLTHSCLCDPPEGQSRDLLEVVGGVSGCRGGGQPAQRPLAAQGYPRGCPWAGVCGHKMGERFFRV